MVYKRTITRFIADDKVVYQRVRQATRWLQTTAEHDVVWSMSAGDHGELSCAYLNGEWQFHAKSHKLIGAFLACPPDWAQGPRLLYVLNAVCHCLVAGQYTRLADSLQQTVDASKFPTLVRQFTEQSSCNILFWQIEIFNQNRSQVSVISVKLSWF